MTWKKSLVASLAVAVGLSIFAVPRLHADSPPAGWEYLHLLIPLDRNLDTYRKSDEALLKPVADAGADGWELVSANEPANGQLVRQRASVEFFFERPRR